MQSRVGRRNPEIEELLEKLHLLAARSDAVAADLVSRALADAESHASDGWGEEVDRAVVAALRARVAVDGVLERIAPPALAALLRRCTNRLTGERPSDGGASCRATHDLLDLLRRPSVLRRIARADVDGWADIILAAVDRSHYTVGQLFRQRVEAYGAKVLFQVPETMGTRVWSWRRAAARVEQLAGGLLALDPDRPPVPVAILSENRIEMALVDLACLTHGLVDVMVPANSTPEDVGYILRHCRARTVIVSGAEQLRKVAANRDSLPELDHVVSLDPVGRGSGDVLPLEKLLARAEQVPADVGRRRVDACRIDDLATVMYTSGTTGTPKGIQFSQRNLVAKRFCRALALPEIGERDVFLCFLPLFHTFGRFLEMLGCVFWGATYCFLESASVEALIRGMKRHRPTVFVSVPKKWIQLHEAIAQRAHPLQASDEELLAATREVTGGRLRWGLSAAGHLDSDIFRFFQRQGVELMSGFGMTEATGGITMTPPGEYRDDSLGPALPGIELDLAEDGELRIRGPYVMVGYLEPPDGETPFDEEGWLHTGDLMVRDTEGHFRLVDRKKEIYKNIKGETIAPQRIENMFRDFDSVSRAFLVGDHREYNTLLIYPNHAYEELDFKALQAQEVKSHFRSLVVSVNKFLAPYERIVDFAVIDRDLAADRGELTPKGTPRRSQVVQNFEPVIRLLYRRTNLQMGGLELMLPNWLLQTLGLTAQDMRVEENRLVLPHSGASLTVRRVDDELAQIGSCLYLHPHGPVLLGTLLTSPPLWLGNEELVRFAPLDERERYRPGRNHEGVEWRGRVRPFDPAEWSGLPAEESGGALLALHRAACALAAADPNVALEGVKQLAVVVSTADEPAAEAGRLVLARAAEAELPEVSRRGFLALAPVEKESRFRRTLERFLSRRADLLDEDTRAELARRLLSRTKIDTFVQLARESASQADDESRSMAAALLRFLSAYGAAHPGSYRRLRAFLVRMSQFAEAAPVRRAAATAAASLRNGFRSWLGPNARVAVDPETGEEYRWDDVVVFAEEVPAEDRARLLGAIEGTAILREASFLFSKGILLRLDDIPPGGIWIRPLGSRHGKSVYRLTIQTRFQGGYDLAINVNHELSARQVEEEIQWLILSGELGGQAPLVEDFGGYWKEHDLWSEEFISGETLARALQRLARRDEEEERFKQIWPFLAWTALSAYVDFWHRCGARWEIADPTMSNVVVPTDDYHTGVRIVSVSARRRHGGLLGMMRSFMDEFITPAVQTYPVLKNIVGWDVVFSSVLEVVGEDRGLEMFGDALRGVGDDTELREALRHYVARVRERGFLPRRLFFAAQRYRRWERLSVDATPQARARTLQELYDTYGLERLAHDYPETRIRFFRETVLREGPPGLIEGLEQLIAALRKRELVGDEPIDAVSRLRAQLTLTEEQDYFLARLLLPYLRPEDTASFVSSDLGGQHQSEIVVNLEDQEGNRFRVRHALNPKEVGRLHRQFLAAKLDVRFRPEHRYLVAINERQQIVGGIYYEIEEGGDAAHLEKIVVSEPYRRKGVAAGLMHEFFNRLRTAGVKTVTTGFFRPEYFYAYGFRIEKRYAGLVKALEDKSADGRERA